MSRRRFFLIFNVLAVSFILIAGFLFYGNRQHISSLKGLFGKAATPAVYTDNRATSGGLAVIDVAINCKLESDINAAGDIVGWNASVTGTNVDAVKFPTTAVRVDTPWAGRITGQGSVIATHYYPGSRAPVLDASAQTEATGGVSGATIACHVQAPGSVLPPGDFGCEEITTDEIFDWFAGVGGQGSFDGAYARPMISGGANGLNYSMVRTTDKSTLTVTISNGTDKCFSGAVGVYKIYDGTLEGQKYFSGKDGFRLSRGSSATFSMPLPNCTAQIDIYGGIEAAPRTLQQPDTQYPLVGWAYHLNQSSSYRNPVGPVCVDPVDREPIGNFDTANCDSITGWVLDQDELGRALDIHVYRDGQAGSGGVFLGSYTTDVLRPDVNRLYGATGNHGFNIPTPESVRDGRSHTVFVYAINPVSGKNNPLLTGSPKTISCPLPPPVLVCSPGAQAVSVGQTASFTASGGLDSYTWSAPGAVVSSGAGALFTTSYAQAGNKQVTVSSGDQRAVCTVTVAVVPPVGVCKLEVTKVVNKTRAAPGDQLSYDITVKNTGTAACGGVTGVKVVDEYDPLIIFISESHAPSVVRGYVGDGSPFHNVSKRVLTWNANVLQPGQSVGMQWIGQVKNMAPCATGAVANIAKATSDEYNHLQSFVTSTKVVTDVIASCPSQLVCSPATQQVPINKPASFSVTGGSGAYTWQAVGGTPSSGSGSSFITQYTQVGGKQVTVRAGEATATCAVVVTEGPTPPSPVVCSPATQTVAVNQQAIFAVSGASGAAAWSAPGGTVTVGTGGTFSTAYTTNGTKLVTVMATNGTATCSVIVTGNPPAQVLDLSVQKNVAPSLIQVGQTAVFTMRVTNNGPVDATGVTLTDTLPSGVSLISHTATQGSFNPDTKVWTVGSLGVSAVAELRLTVSGDSVGSKLNTVSLSGSTPVDTNPANNQAQATLTVVTGSSTPDVVCAPAFQTVRVNQQFILAAVGGTNNYNWTAPEATPSTGTGNSFSAYYTSVGSRTVTVTSGTKQTTCTVNVAPEPVPTPGLDLGVTKLVSPALIQPGQGASFTVTITNLSTVQGNSIQYKDVLPAGLGVISAVANRGAFSVSSGLWDVGSLAPAESATLTVQVSATQVGTFVNQVHLVAVTPQDTNAVNNSASATLIVQTPPGGGSPSLVCASDTNSALINQDIKFYANNATGAYAWSANNGTPSVGSGSIFTTRFLQEGTHLVTVTSGGQTATCTVAITALTLTGSTADLSLTKAAGPIRLSVGQETIFTLTLRNDGPGSPDLVSVKDVLPQGMTLIRAVASQGSYEPLTGIWTVGRMLAGQEVVLLITVKAEKTGELTNEGEVWTSGLPDADSTPGNGHATEDDQASAAVTVGDVLPKSGSPVQPIMAFALICIAAAAAVQVRTIRVARLQTPLGEVEIPLDSV